MSTTTYLGGSVSSLLSTELNSLANNSLAVPASSGTYSSGGNYLRAEIELVVTFGTAPTVPSSVPVWFIRAVDATPHYEDGYDASLTPARDPDLVFPIRAVTTTQRVILRRTLPPGTWIPLIKNDATGQSFAATGNTLKILPYTYQG